MCVGVGGGGGGDCVKGSRYSFAGLTHTLC